MSFVIYDIETTGLNKRFDQILQFAAVRVNADLVVQDRVDIRIRLMPHVVPSPAALHINGTDIGEITDPRLPTHYQAVKEIASTLHAWSPTLFLGYSSLQFDEEFLRQALYLNLLPPYLTNTNGNARADVLKLVRAVAAMEPGSLYVPMEEGRPSFRLSALSRANGYVGGPSHDAANDVDATLHLCRIVAERAPELWSRLLKFSSRRVVADFVSEEDAFLYLDQVGSTHSTHIVTSLGPSTENRQLHFCLDLSADLDGLSAMDAETLASLMAGSSRPIRRLRLNAAPMLVPLYDVPADAFDGKTEEFYVKRVSELRRNAPLMARLRSAAQAAERVYPASVHVEEQIYSGGFPSDDEAALLTEFHAADWPRRRELVSEFVDPRHRLLAIRLIYLEQPELLSKPHRDRISDEISMRRKGRSHSQPACMTVAQALSDIATLRAGTLDSDALSRLSKLEKHLNALAGWDRTGPAA